MPRYAYKCDRCKGVFEISHGMFFEQNKCELCHSLDCLTKIPNFSIKKKVKDKKKRVGSVVDEYIVDAKEELKKQKKDLKQEILKT